MCGIIGSVSTLIVGAVLVVASCVISFVFVPNIIQNVIKGEVLLLDDTIQLERFEQVPFPLNFTVRIFNISNPEEVMNGNVPVVTEVGPYVYRLYQDRELLGMTEDTIRYKRRENFEFDAIASYPNTEADMVTIINVPYHAIIQVAESSFSYLMSVLSLAMAGVFGDYNSPIATFNVRDLLFGGIPMCKGTGIVAGIACGIIRDIGAGAQNIEEEADGSLVFSILAYKGNYPSKEYEVLRGINDPADLGRIISYNESPHFIHWVNKTDRDPGVCNMINGTDAGIFAPFVDRNKHIYAINTDICRNNRELCQGVFCHSNSMSLNSHFINWSVSQRQSLCELASVELRYELDSEYMGIPTVRFSADEWLLDNDEGCFCLNVTHGLNRPDGCLLKGAMELYSCVGAFLVMSYPHFLFADHRYSDGVIGMRPDEQNHKIFMDIEPNTGTPVRGAKRAQFNIFMKPISGIAPTQNLRTTLVPILWVEESILLPDEFVDELTSRLLNSLRLVGIIIPVFISVCGVVLLLGAALVIRVKCKKPKEQVPMTTAEAVD